MPEPLKPETVKLIEQELLGTALPDADRPGVAGLVAALLTDMAALRKADVGQREPVTTFSARPATSGGGQ